MHEDKFDLDRSKIVHPRQRADEPEVSYSEYLAIIDMLRSNAERLHKETERAYKLEKEVALLHNRLAITLSSANWIMSNWHKPHECEEYDERCVFCQKWKTLSSMVHAWLREGV